MQNSMCQLSVVNALVNVCIYSEDEHKLIQQYCHNLNGHKSDNVSFHFDIFVS